MAICQNKMLSFLILSVASKEVVENPPVTYGTPTTYTRSNKYSAYSISGLESILRNTGLFTSEQITKLVQKMKFSSSSNTIENSFEMTINPYSTSSRTATQVSTVLKISKSGSTFSISVGTASVKLPVYSQVIKTTSSTFLWWEWDKKITITWRPLTSSELSQVHNRVENFMSLLIAPLKK